jgi:hypothetical protein
MHHILYQVYLFQAGLLKLEAIETIHNAKKKKSGMERPWYVMLKKDMGGFPVLPNLGVVSIFKISILFKEWIRVYVIIFNHLLLFRIYGLQ